LNYHSHPHQSSKEIKKIVRLNKLIRAEKKKTQKTQKLRAVLIFLLRLMGPLNQCIIIDVTGKKDHTKK
jgi:hypothetical protein